MSLHIEYDLEGVEKGLSTIKMAKKDVFTYIKRDLTFLKAA
jgi:hypothetical protein